MFSGATLYGSNELTARVAPRGEMICVLFFLHHNTPHDTIAIGGGGLSNSLASLLAATVVSKPPLHWLILWHTEVVRDAKYLLA